MTPYPPKVLEALFPDPVERSHFEENCVPWQTSLASAKSLLASAESQLTDQGRTLLRIGVYAVNLAIVKGCTSQASKAAKPKLEKAAAAYGDEINRLISQVLQESSAGGPACSL